MSDIVLRDDFGKVKSLNNYKGQVDVSKLKSGYVDPKFSVFKKESGFAPQCFINDSCSFYRRVKSCFSLCDSCGFRSQSRLC